MKHFFKVGKNNIGWVGSSFQEHFGDMEIVIPRKVNLKTRVLEKSMNDQEILAEFKPHDSTLGELAYAMKNDSILLKNGYANIFYIRDKNNELWAVGFGWRSDFAYWNVGAYPVGNPNVWDAGRQVLSSDWNFDNSDTSDTVNLRPYETLDITIETIKINGKTYKLHETT